MVIFHDICCEGYCSYHEREELFTTQCGPLSYWGDLNIYQSVSSSLFCDIIWLFVQHWLFTWHVQLFEYIVEHEFSFYIAWRVSGLAWLISWKCSLAEKEGRFENNWMPPLCVARSSIAFMTRDWSKKALLRTLSGSCWLGRECFWFGWLTAGRALYKSLHLS